MVSYYEQIKKDAPSSAIEINKKARIEWDGHIGDLVRGKYYEYQLPVWH
jgi:hypothetical protein